MLTPHNTPPYVTSPASTAGETAGQGRAHADQGDHARLYPAFLGMRLCSLPAVAEEGEGFLRNKFGRSRLLLPRILAVE